MLRKARSSFRVCGYTGLALTISLAMMLITHLRLSPWVMTALILSAMATFLALAMITKIIVAGESLIYYHQEIAVMFMAAVVLWLLRQPALPYLDVTILGVGMFLAFGRIGCLMVGCCHGRPHRWGVRYREEHAAAGFPPYLVGVRLFPVQALEAICVFCIVLIGSALVLSGRPPGEALAWYTVGYGIVRFCFEFMRGDVERPYLRGFSEAQWTSLILVGCTVAAEARGVLPLRPWHAVAVLCLCLTFVAVSVWRHFRRTAMHELLHPRHVKEIAEVIDVLSRRAEATATISGDGSEPSVIAIACTSRGVQITTDIIPGLDGWIHLYALSSKGGGMMEETATALAGLILKLKYNSASCEIVRGGKEVFHALIRTTNGTGRESSPQAKLIVQEGRHAF